MTTLSLAGLTTHIVGPSDATTTVVLMHGFGAPGTDLVSLARELSAPVRFVFPEAPLELGGMYGAARAWWLLDLARLERERSRGGSNLTAEVPAGLADAREQVSGLLDALEAKFGGPDHRLVLGGFSQGAMVAVDVALHREQPPAALVVMSGTLIAAREWTPLMPKLAGIPVLQSHGKHDLMLPYAIAEQLRDQLTTAGALVEWHPFLGGHEIPRPVLAAIDELLVKLA